MTKKELPQYSAYLVTEYYKNNVQPALNAFSDNCLWIGPAKGQIIYSKKSLLAAFASDDNKLTFDVHNLQIIPTPINNTSMDVVAAFSVTTHYPNGDIIVFQQRLELVWVEEKITEANGKIQKEYRIRVCHISNEYPYDARDTIYPNHFTELAIAKLYTARQSLNKFSLKGINHSYFYLSADSIIWLITKGTHTIIHTTSGEYESLEGLSSIVEKYSGFLCRIHISYAINPIYVSSIGRFYVLMEDGTRISIPEKKYTITRNEINAHIKKIRK